MPAALTTAGVY